MSAEAAGLPAGLVAVSVAAVAIATVVAAAATGARTVGRNAGGGGAGTATRRRTGAGHDRVGAIPDALNPARCLDDDSRYREHDEAQEQAVFRQVLASLIFKKPQNCAEQFSTSELV